MKKKQTNKNIFYREKNKQITQKKIKSKVENNQYNANNDFKHHDFKAERYDEYM